MLLYRKQIARQERIRKENRKMWRQRGIVPMKPIDVRMCHNELIRKIREKKRKVLVDSIIDELAKKLGKVGQ